MTWLATLQHSARLAQWVMTCFTGKPQSWDLVTVHIREVFSSWQFIFQQTTPSNHPRLHLRQEFTTQILTVTAVSVWIFSDHSGLLHLPFLKFFSPFAHCYVTQTLMTHWCQRLHDSTKQIVRNTPKWQKNGQSNTQCDGIVWKGGGKCCCWFKLKIPGFWFFCFFFSLFFLFFFVNQSILPLYFFSPPFALIRR